MAKTRKVFWLTVLVFAISSAGNFEALGQRRPTGEKGRKGQQQMVDMRGFMQKMFNVYSDKQNGGVYSACSEDFSKVVDSRKGAANQLLLGRSYVFQHMGSGRPEPKDKAVELIDLALTRFEDKENGGYNAWASDDWTVVGKEKDLGVVAELIPTLIHVYEITFDDIYLLKCFEAMDLILEKCEDKENGGIFDSFAEDWTPTSRTKSLSTQMKMILHLIMAWKDGIDSPYAVRAEFYKKKSMELADLVIEKMHDPTHGGFFKTCNADWSVKDDGKDVEGIASAVSSLFFSYHGRGPVLWGPRKGSHAYGPDTVYRDDYSYRGPAPDPRPIGMDAYHVGTLVVESAKLLVEKAWDKENGGFYQSLSRDWKPLDKTKGAATQATVMMALNIAYKMTGDPAIRKTLAEEVEVLPKRAWDSINGGYYDSYSESWAPKTKEKTFSANMGLIGVTGMVIPTLRGPEVSPLKLKVWIEPDTLTIEDGQTGQCTVTIQNQGFLPEKVRIGGMFALIRWMDPQESVIDLAPHQIHTYTLKILPPQGLAGKTYPFEVSAVSQSNRTKYFSDIAILNIK